MAINIDSYGLPIIQGTLYPTPDDVICKEEVNSAYNNHGTSAGFDERDFFISLSNTTVQRLRQGRMEAEAAPLVAEYIKWSDKCVKELSELLEVHYPNRWDIHKGGEPLVVDRVRFIEMLHGTNGMVDKFSSYSASSECTYKAVIHYPRIVITNSREEVHTIKDLYVILEFDVKFSLKAVKSYRATKSYREYLCNYTHSHSQVATNGITGFCFGSTSLDSLVGELRHATFNLLGLELLLQNLPDYLSWESLEGVPYQSISEVINKRLDSAVQPNIPSGILTGVYNSVMSSPQVQDMDVSVGYLDGTYHVVVEKNRKLLGMISVYTPGSLKFPLDELRMTTIYKSTPNYKHLREEVQYINRTESSRVLLRFRGADVRFTVEELEEQEDMGNPSPLYADVRIMEYIANKLAGALTKHLYDKFWKGTKERGVQ